MKALSLSQPWANLIVVKAKQQETRSWSTKHRGTIAIHASQGFKKENLELCDTWPFNEYIKAVNALPLGRILGIADVIDVITSETCMIDMNKSESERSQEEYRFGNYAPNRFVWKLKNIKMFDTPIVCKGALSLWTIP